jgi:hypothetical protein
LAKGGVFMDNSLGLYVTAVGMAVVVGVIVEVAGPDNVWFFLDSVGLLVRGLEKFF